MKNIPHRPFFALFLLKLKEIKLLLQDTAWPQCDAWATLKLVIRCMQRYCLTGATEQVRASAKPSGTSPGGPLLPNERSARVIGGLDAAPVGPGGFIEQLPGQPFEFPSGVEVVSRLDLCYIRGEVS